MQGAPEVELQNFGEQNWVEPRHSTPQILDRRLQAQQQVPPSFPNCPNAPHYVQDQAEVAAHHSTPEPGMEAE